MFFGCALFGPSCQKREILDTHPKKKKIFTDKLKSSFLSFFCFFLFFSLFLFFLFFLFCFFFWCFFWRVEGSCEVARRATSLGPKPSLFVFLFLFCFCFCFFSLVFLFGGFKGQVRWPEGPPHLALNPPYLFVFICFFGCFLFSFWFLSFLCFNRKTCFFPPKRGIFWFIFSA